MQVDPGSAFDALMAGLGLGPADGLHLAVAVSGGADSLALAMLADAWARSRGRRITALTVDHALRPESASEAAQVGGWLAAYGISHHILVRRGPRPRSDIQAAARDARYDLLTAWCRSNGVSHLLLGHHLDDQAETLLLRLGRGSGVDGLAAMAPLSRRDGITLVRPLLEVPAAALKAWLKARRQAWIEDPSNADPAFARVRLRGLMPALAGEGLTAERLAGTARRLARAKDALDWMVAGQVRRFVRLDPAGFALADPQAFAGVPAEIGLRLLVRLLLAVGGGDYPPRQERTEALHDRLLGGEPGKATLAGCTIVWTRDQVLICREAARQSPPIPLEPGHEFVWDRRMQGRVPADLPAGLSLGGLGHQGWRRLKGVPAVPAPARAGLAALMDGDGIFAVPHLGYKRDGGAISHEWIVWFAPMRHCLVPDRGGII